MKIEKEVRESNKVVSDQEERMCSSFEVDWKVLNLTLLKGAVYDIFYG
jgi:hypothetical protein